MHQKIFIVDFGSQYTQLIARRVRELCVYSEIIPCNQPLTLSPEVKGIILSGSPYSVEDDDAPQMPEGILDSGLPVLGICYGAQLIARKMGGMVKPSHTREYGRAHLKSINPDSPLFTDIPEGSQVWMSHADTITSLPASFDVIASTETVDIAAYQAIHTAGKSPIFGIQFHPEVYHTSDGITLLRNFVMDICGCKGDWTPASFIQETVSRLKGQIGKEKVVMGLSGGVDSTVAAELIHQAIGDNLYCVFVDNGLLRKNEFHQVLHSYRDLGLNVKGVDARQAFLSALKSITDPEDKRKIIGRVFVEVFQEEAKKIKDVTWLGQGTIYPDVIESQSVHGPSATIKSHHNVGGLPEILHLKVVEPLRMLFKDEVRRVGSALGIPAFILERHPFPGPGLAIRIIGEITEQRLQILREADAIFINKLKESGWYQKVWQAGAIFLPLQSVGVMGDERTYEYVIALRAVHSVDGMTADWSRLPGDLLADISNTIINEVKGVNRVVYDISSKPPSTIEWE